MGKRKGKISATSSPLSVTVTPECLTEGLEEYHAHRDTFVNTLGDHFFKALSKWLSAETANLENFKANFDWDSVQNSVKMNLSKPIASMVDKHKVQIIDSMIRNLSQTLGRWESNMAIFLKGNITCLTPIQECRIHTGHKRFVECKG